MTIDKLIRTKRRSISMQISQMGELIVRAPINCSYEKILKTLEEKRGWIELHQNRILENNQLNSDIISYNKILFLGYTYNIVFVDKLKKIEKTTENFFVPQKYKENKQKLKRVLAKRLIVEAQNIFEDRVIYFANLMQLKPTGITLTNSKRNWGSCDQNSSIKLNWRLVMTLPDIIDYVIVHELSHILEFNHSKIFWEIVGSVIPNYKERRQSLKKGDFLLNLFR